MEFYQDAPVLNYPNTHAYTRVTEFKYLTGRFIPLPASSLKPRARKGTLTIRCRGRRMRSYTPSTCNWRM